jgi:iron complex transport system permease protein
MRSVIGLACLLTLLCGLGCLVGADGWRSPHAMWSDAGWRALVWDIRLPRSLGAAVVGGLLGLSGAVAQGLFRNPLAEPHLLGSAAGAGLCMAAAIALGWVSGDAGVRLGLTGLAFVGAVGGVLLTLMLARGAAQTYRLLLAGVVVGVVLGAFTQWIMLGSAEAWRAMQAFMLGNTALLGWPAVGALSGVWALGALLAVGLAPVLDALSLGEDTARSLGVPLGASRVALVAVRGWDGGRHRVRLLAASLMGGVLLVSADLLSRGLLPPQDVPVGVLTAVLGGGYLLWRLNRGGA